MPKSRSRIWIAGLVLTGVLFTIWVVLTRTDTAALREEMRRAYARNNFEKVEKLCQQILAVETDADDIRLIAAECAADRGSSIEALKHLQAITSADSELQLKVSLMSAELLHHSLFRLSDAELAYQNALRLSPQNAVALTGYVQLLSTCGRRREALPYLFDLVRLGQASDLLIVAARSTGAINDPELLKNALVAVPADACALLGMALQASQDGDIESAIKLCKDALAANPELTSAEVALGQYLLDAERHDELVAWETGLSQASESMPETWLVKGHIYEHQNRFSEAIQSYLKALRLGPDLKTAYYRLSVLCRQNGDNKAADYFTKKLEQLRELEILQDRMFQVGPSDPSAMFLAIRGFQQCGRMWEAIGWSTIAVAQHPQNAELQTLWRELQPQLAELPQALSLAEELPTISMSADIAEPRRSPVEVPARNQTEMKNGRSISFRNDAASSRLLFRYINGVTGPTTHRMFEFTGGGIGIIDVDLDDYPDAFLTQGGLWQGDGVVTDASDAVFRNRRGGAFEVVTNDAGVQDDRFGQGVAVGDINNDGFQDVFVANIGANRIWLNCGDGTFVGHDFPMHSTSEASDLVSENGIKWSSSAAIADLNLDGAADIYVVNYLSGKDVFTRVCTAESGRSQACVPVHFDAAADNVYLNQQDGGFSDESKTLSAISPGKGLGVLVFRASDSQQPAIYVANDTTPNMLLTMEHIAQGIVNDTGMATGVALNAAGKAEGSMGITAADLNSDGRLELFVTNFYNESNTLYQQFASGFFDDRTADWNLRDSSLPLLGFGTQFFDADGDAFPELFIANGHVDDLQWAGKPYAMRAQCLAMDKSRFQELSPAQLGSYFESEHLGRAVALLDWNRDTLPDLLIGHLNEDYALLTNTSKGPGRIATARCVGVQSCRDAVLTTAIWAFDGRNLSDQLKAGDGYYCSNQKQLWFSGGAEFQASPVQVQWPSGVTQTFDEVQPGHRYVMLEQRNQVYVLPE